MDISDIQYADGTFGFVYCSHVLEHVPDDKRAMRELRRVLTDNGLAILLVPIDGDNTFEDPSVSDPKDRLKLFGQEDHVRRYGLDFEERLREAGFKVERTRPGDFLSTIEIEKMGISKAAGDIYSCKK
jgi:SAM-dependent methyltransferase